MRKLEFRAYKDGKMTYSYNPDVRASEKLQLVWFFNKITEDSILMDFTGLKDKSGNKIFEGDILKIQLPLGGFWGTVSTEKIGQVIYNEDRCEYIIECEWPKNQHHITLDCDVIVQVIGNIYENPELLKS